MPRRTPTHLTKPSINKAPRNIPLPLSTGQQRMWRQTTNPYSSTENILHFAVRLTGKLNVEALQRSFDDLIERHDVLRTNFVVHDDKPSQIVVEKESRLRFQIHELPLDSPSRLRSFVYAEAGKPFNLSKDLLLRVTLVSLSKHEFLLLLTVPHLIFDALSKHILYRDLSQFYNFYAFGTALALPYLVFTYGDFAYTEQVWKKTQALSFQHKYWREKLGDCPPLLNLPTDKPRPDNPSLRVDCLKHSWSRQLTRQTRSISRELRMTEYSTVLCAIKILLLRQSGQADVVVTSSIGNRDRVELVDVMGYLVSPVRLRTDLLGDPTFSDAVSRVQQTSFEALAHADVPYTMPDIESREVLVWQPDTASSLAALDLGGIDKEECFVSHMPGRSTGHKLTIGVFSGESRIDIYWQYELDMFYRSTIERMSNELCVLLEKGVNEPFARLSELLRIIES